MAKAIVRYPARGQAPEIFAMRLKAQRLDIFLPQTTCKQIRSVKSRKYMVYLNLSVNSITQSIEFYCSKLGVFNLQAGNRLIFNLDAELIIDLIEVATLDHKKYFGQVSHSLSAFGVHVGDDEHHQKISILERLLRGGVRFNRTRNLGGDFLEFTDPSQNKFFLHAHLGIFE